MNIYCRTPDGGMASAATAARICAEVKGRKVWITETQGGGLRISAENEMVILPAGADAIEVYPRRFLEDRFVSEDRGVRLERIK